MKRDWTAANAEKRGPCRVCGRMPVELAHVIGREHDHPVRDGMQTLWVNPDSVVPLCGNHHRRYDAYEFDLLPYLTLAEQIQAVRDAGGLELARRRSAPGAYDRVGIKSEIPPLPARVNGLPPPPSRPRKEGAI